jgi:hypothetical protein
MTRASDPGIRGTFATRNGYALLADMQEAAYGAMAQDMEPVQLDFLAPSRRRASTADAGACA